MNPLRRRSLQSGDHSRLPGRGAARRRGDDARPRRPARPVVRGLPHPDGDARDRRRRRRRVPQLQPAMVRRRRARRSRRRANVVESRRAGTRALSAGELAVVRALPSPHGGVSIPRGPSRPHRCMQRARQLIWTFDLAGAIDRWRAFRSAQRRIDDARATDPRSGRRSPYGTTSQDQTGTRTSASRGTRACAGRRSGRGAASHTGG